MKLAEDGSEPLKNVRHEIFAQEWARGKSQAEAYTIAGYAPGKALSHAHRMGGNGGIIARKNYLQQKSQAKLSLSREEWLESFVRIAKNAENMGDSAAARGCLRELGLAMSGWYTPALVDAAVKITVERAWSKK